MRLPEYVRDVQPDRSLAAVYIPTSSQLRLCNDSVGTVTGSMFMDVFELGEMKASSTVGTIEWQERNFQQFYVIDGVIGTRLVVLICNAITRAHVVLGFACFLSYGYPIPVEALARSGQIADSFSYCFDKSGEGGLLTLVCSLALLSLLVVMLSL